MRLCKVVYIVVLLFFSLQFTHATGYVDLSTYDGKKYKDSQEGLIEGLFDFDDIFHNPLGAILGIGMCMFVKYEGKRLIGKPG